MSRSILPGFKFDIYVEPLYNRSQTGAIQEDDMNNAKFRYDHIGIPTTKPMEGEVYLPGYKLYHFGYESSEFGIEWMRYEPDCTLPELVKTVPHVAFEVDDIREALKGRKVIIEPNSPSEGVTVAFVEEDGAPIELIERKC